MAKFIVTENLRANLCDLAVSVDGRAIENVEDADRIIDCRGSSMRITGNVAVGARFRFVKKEIGLEVALDELGDGLYLIEFDSARSSILLSAAVR